MFRTLPRFEYLSPETLGEAIALLKEYGGKAKVLAGGTDLIPQMKWGEYRPEVVITLNRIPGLDQIDYHEKSGLKLGALSRIAKIEKSEVLRKHYPLLPRAASLLACSEIRNRGTVGGNLCTAVPSADMPPSLLALQASAVIGSEKGERVLPLEEFFLGPKKTVLSHDEILLRLELPPMQPDSAGEYIKFGRRNAMEIAMIGVAAVLTVAPDKEKCLDAKLAFATAAPTPMRAREAEKILINSRLDADVIEEAAQRASREASPRSSWRTSEEYRREIIPVLTRRAIRNALNKIGH
ncbi:MAG: xanthine dehydrogenase family protein subunit M [Pseudomonadota bacterium]